MIQGLIFSSNEAHIDVYYYDRAHFKAIPEIRKFSGSISEILKIDRLSKKKFCISSNFPSQTNFLVFYFGRVSGRFFISVEEIDC